MAYRVDTERLQQAFEKLQEFDRKTQERIERIDDKVKDLHIVWQGVDAKAHEQAHHKMMMGLKELVEGADKLHRRGTTTHSNYTEAQTRDSHMWD